MRRWLLALTVLTLCQCARTPTPGAEDIAAVVEAGHPPFAVNPQPRSHHVWDDTQRFYRQRSYQLAWSDGRRPRALVADLIRALRASSADGLNLENYRIDALEALRSSFNPAHAVVDDVQWTYAYLQLAADLTSGTVDPESIDPHWHAAPPSIDSIDALAEGIESGRLAESLQKLAPHAPQYVALKRHLAASRDDASTSSLIATNMERWRWLPDDLGDRYILVNIPAYRLDVVENGKSVLEMKVVTGKKNSRTPVLSDRMTQVVFSPYWNIPSDIVDHEILPKAEKDPGFLDRMNIESDGDRYRQRPGLGNSLGLVKFVFPNHYNVYLHDTPAHALFAHDERDLSHGCVRLERPGDLATYLLRDQGDWTDDKIAAAMQAGTERGVTLERPLPIYLTYFTAWNENGTLRTADDVYGYDRRRHNAEGE